MLVSVESTSPERCQSTGKIRFIKHNHLLFSISITVLKIEEKKTVSLGHQISLTMKRNKTPHFSKKNYECMKFKDLLVFWVS